METGIVAHMRKEAAAIRKDEGKYPELQYRTSAQTIEDWADELQDWTLPASTGTIAQWRAKAMAYADLVRALDQAALALEVLTANEHIQGLASAKSEVFMIWKIATEQATKARAVLSAARGQE